MMSPFSFLEPIDLSEVFSLLLKYKRRIKLLAGGTDLLVAMKERLITPEYLINLKAIPGLDHIHGEEEVTCIGALANIADMETSSFLKERIPVLAQTARQIANPGIRHMATVGGNLCNAAPSADMAPPLIGLGARVRINGPNGQRTVPVQDFFLGPGKNVLREGEVLTRIDVPHPSPRTKAAYVKMLAKTAVGIALVGVAAVVILDEDSDRIRDAKIALGAVAPTPIRAFGAEGILKGNRMEKRLLEEAAMLAASETKPISDVRGSAEYRREMVKVLTRRALMETLKGSNER
jgi:carbon-monoxide dehydrogenase medium subunit